MTSASSSSVQPVDKLQAEKVAAMLFRLNAEHPNVQNVLTSTYLLLNELKATLATSVSDETMHSTDTYREKRLLKEIDAMKEEVTQVIGVSTQAMTNFGQIRRVGYLSHFWFLSLRWS